MATYSLHLAQFEMLLILASRSLSDLAIKLAQEANEEVATLPTQRQFVRAYKVNQEQVGWLQEALEAYLIESGKIRDDSPNTS